MIPFVAAKIKAIIEDIRLLESFVTAPLGLHSDIKMLRESLSLPEAMNLTREEVRQRRMALSLLTESPLELALDTIQSLNTSLCVLGNATGEGGSTLNIEWVARARRVLVRAEERVTRDMRVEARSRIRGLYVIVDPEVIRGRPILEIAEAALKGGVQVLQLRDKTRDWGDVMQDARALRSICDQFGALFMMNDNAVLALSSNAHGLHVGQSDLPVSEARRILAPRQLVGRSNNSVDEAMESQARGADYLAVGAIYSTPTMGKSHRKTIGPKLVGKIKELVDSPIVAIGGINAGNIEEVVMAGADCICVVSAVTLASDPEAAASKLVDAIERTHS